MSSPKICIAGKNEIAVNALLWIIELGLVRNLLVCPNKSDNGISNWQPSLKRYAKEYGVTIISLEQAEKIKDLIFISLEFDRIIHPDKFESRRIYNIHFSALPAYKGMYTSALPILHGSSHSGVTLHEIDSGIDTGPIIDQIIFSIEDFWTARDLYFSYMQHGLALFKRHFQELYQGAPRATAQPFKGSSYYSKSSIDYSSLKLNTQNTAEGIVRQLRAFTFREYQVVSLDDMKIGSWSVLNERSKKKFGTILSADSNFITISTIDYNLTLGRFSELDWFDSTLSFMNLKLSNINNRDSSGWTPLIKASYACNLDLCTRLLQAGANPNKTNMNGTTPLMYALSSPNNESKCEVIKLLLEHGADPNQKDGFGRDVKYYHHSLESLLKTHTCNKSF